MFGKSYKTVTVQTTIEGAVSDAFSEFEALRDEMAEWRDNLEEKFSQTDKYSQVSDAADALDVVDNTIDVPECLQAIPVTTIQGVKRSRRQGPSRDARKGNAVALLDAAKGAAEDYLADGVEAEEAALTPEQEEELARGDKWLVTDEQRNEIDQFMDEVQEIIDNVDAVEFPGMYG